MKTNSITESQFKRWFNKARREHGFFHFSWHELAVLCEREYKTVKNSYPPEHLLENAIPTLNVAQQLRIEIKEPLYITSWYRNPDYNKAVGGVKNSRHQYCDALDLYSRTVNAERLYKILKFWRQRGEFVGGLGVYKTSNFIHLDTRGYNVSWHGN